MGNLLSKQQCPFLMTGRAKIETKTGKRNKVIMSAFWILAFYPGNTFLEITALGNLRNKHPGGTPDFDPCAKAFIFRCYDPVPRYDDQRNPYSWKQEGITKRSLNNTRFDQQRGKGSSRQDNIPGAPGQHNPDNLIALLIGQMDSGLPVRPFGVDAFACLVQNDVPQAVDFSPAGQVALHIAPGVEGMTGSRSR
jgi:hypothetical protein